MGKLNTISMDIFNARCEGYDNTIEHLKVSILELVKGDKELYDKIEELFIDAQFMG